MSDGGRAESELLAAAKAGDEAAFGELTRPFQRELHVHAYRMLGSLDDADDALQETLLRSWRRIGGFEPRAPFRAWLYQITTNVCLTLLERRTRRGEISVTALEEARDAGRQESEPMHLDPYPDRLLDELGPAMLGPEATVEQQESVELAFVTAVQFLPPRQRATLLLRDVIGYSAAEVATMLKTSVAGINSALQRARTTLERERDAGHLIRSHSAQSGCETEETLVRRLVDAWHAVDVPSIVSLLTADALFTMPPEPMRFEGREAIGAFLTTGPAGGHLDKFRLVPTRANRQPAIAAYRLDEAAGIFRAHGVMVLAIEGDEISSMTRFGYPNLLKHFGLPMTLERTDPRD